MRANLSLPWFIVLLLPEKPSAASTNDRWAALAASFLGWSLDAFDFFLVVLCLTAIGAEFHKSDKEIALSLFLTLAFRPVGAFLFGLIADRYGRRLPLMIDLVFYSIVEVATGFSPNFTTFLILRALFGIGMGGEWGSAPHSPWKRCLSSGAASSLELYNRATPLVICSRRSLIFSSFHGGDGGLCSSWEVCRRS